MTLTPKEFRRAERGFSRATARFSRNASWELDGDELWSARQVVGAFDLSLECVPAFVLAQAHRYAQANFSAPLQQRISMSSLADDNTHTESVQLRVAAA
jgi:hypothetical protein